MVESLRKDKESLIFTGKESTDLIQFLEDQKAKLSEDYAKNLDLYKQSQAELKQSKDKQNQLQEYCSRLTNDRNNIKL